MTQENDVIDELERLHAAATPGPWRALRQGNQYLGIAYLPTAKLVGASMLEGPKRPWNPYAAIAHGEDAKTHEECRFTDEDADYIAETHNRLPALLAYVRAQDAFIAAQTQWIKDYEDLVEKSSRWCHDSTEWDQAGFEYEVEWNALWQRRDAGRAELVAARERLGAK